MNVYTTDSIRNVVLLGHGGSGKTSLVEAMAYVSGLTSRIGKVTDGTTISDYDKEEIKRKFSINTSVVPIVWKDTKINILDTPGFFDFVGEVEEAVAAADAAVIVVSGKAGVEVGTEKAWELCEKYKLPRMFFVSDMDVDNASFREVVETLTELYGKKIAPFYQPIRENEKFVGYVNVMKMAETARIDYKELTGQGENESSASIRGRVEAAQKIQRERYAQKECRWNFNSQLPSAALSGFCFLGSEEQKTMETAFEKLHLSARAYHRIIKVARTIADLEGEARIRTVHLLEAIGYRAMDQKFWGG